MLLPAEQEVQLTLLARTSVSGRTGGSPASPAWTLWRTGFHPTLDQKTQETEVSWWCYNLVGRDCCRGTRSRDPAVNPENLRDGAVGSATWWAVSVAAGPGGAPSPGSHAVLRGLLPGHFPGWIFIAAQQTPDT
mmetsp:Transcript_11892/g.29832  ORF Transcript_11892/g.29832 Transcript_11892/m.29832 type:complete len:134 (-) Transcript_11892:71-472(-)